MILGGIGGRLAGEVLRQAIQARLGVDALVEQDPDIDFVRRLRFEFGHQVAGCLCPFVDALMRLNERANNN